MLLHFALALHFAAILITFCINITFCGDFYILRRNTLLFTTLYHNNFREKIIRNVMHLQIRCKSLPVICMEIEGSVKLSENIHNIWIAWKPAVSSQTRTRRNIVPKFLKNAMKTVFAFCIFHNGWIYLSIPSEAKTCFLEPMFKKLVVIFYTRIIISSRQGWTL